MEKKMRVLISFGILIALVLGFYLISFTITKFTGYTITGKAVYSKEEKMQIASCLKEKGAVLYCSAPELSLNCLRQKKELGEAFTYINYVECSENPEQCKDLSLPAWKINERIYYGIHSLDKLGEIAGCKVRF